MNAAAAIHAAFTLSDGESTHLLQRVVMISVAKLSSWLPDCLIACWPAGLLACWPASLLACSPAGL